MKYLFLAFIIFISTKSNSQNWLYNKIGIRKTYDGSKNERKPANISFKESHNSNNDFVNVDIGVKVSEVEVTNDKTIFTLYPVLEWHKSTDSLSLKNKVSAVINFEFVPFMAKSKNIGDAGLKLSPWFQGSLIRKRNLIENVMETKFVGQVSLYSNYDYLPGARLRNSNHELVLRYYPYIGYERYRLPDLIVKGQTEQFNTLFFRLFIEAWPVERTIQLLVDGTFKKEISSNDNIDDNLSSFSLDVNFYPGKQEKYSIGYEYHNGVDTNAKFKKVNQSQLKFNVLF